MIDIEHHLKEIAKAHLNAKHQELSALINDIKANELTTSEQVIQLIEVNLKIVSKLINESEK